MSEAAENIVNFDPEPEEHEPDILREAVTVDLIAPVTVDGVTYAELTFDFAGRIKSEDITKFKATWKRLNPDEFNPVPIAEEDYQELYLTKAGNISLAVLRSLEAADKAGVYGLALEWLGKSSVKKKRRKR
jgi:hypothetical protein